jgi:hypothetical protein
MKMKKEEVCSLVCEVLTSNRKARPQLMKLVSNLADSKERK